MLGRVYPGWGLKTGKGKGYGYPTVLKIAG